MAKEQIVKYLKEHKDNYSKEALRKVLIDTGYGESDVDEAIKEAYLVDISEVASALPGTVFQGINKQSSPKEESAETLERKIYAQSDSSSKPLSTTESSSVYSPELSEEKQYSFTAQGQAFSISDRTRRISGLKTAIIIAIVFMAVLHYELLLRISAIPDRPFFSILSGGFGG